MNDLPNELKALFIKSRYFYFKKAWFKAWFKAGNRDELLSNNDKYHIQKFWRMVTVSEPYTLGEVDQEIKEEKFIHNYYWLPFVCEVPDAELVGPTAAGFDRDGNIIAETIVLYFPKKTILKKMCIYTSFNSK